MSGESEKEGAEKEEEMTFDTEEKRADNSDECAGEDNGGEDASQHRGQKIPLSDLDYDHLVHVPHIESEHDSCRSSRKACVNT